MEKNQAASENKMASCFSVIRSDRCSGCGFCSSVCPKNCLKMTTLPTGFSVAEIVDPQACIHCGKCAKFCPEMRSVQLPEQPPRCYAVWHKNPEIVRQSSSGGAFTAIAEAVIRSGGVVAGVAMENNQARYVLANSLPELAALRGSKYLPAEIQPVVEKIKEALQNGRTVLLTTLPCLALAVRKSIPAEKYPGKLYLADLVCSGVPAPRYFAREVQGKTINVETFRRKGAKNNWRHSRALWGKDSGTGREICIPVEKSPFYNAFACGQIFRNNCYDCKHANLDRASDLTLGDFWGETRFPDQQSAGISMVLINSPAGQDLFDRAASGLIVHEASLIDAARKNPRLYFGVDPRRDDNLRKKFSQNFEKLPFHLLKILYRGGCKLGISGKLLYRLLWRKNTKNRKRIQQQQQLALDEFIRLYPEKS